MNYSRLRDMRPFFIFCVFISAFLLVQRKWVYDKGLDRDMLIVANLLLFIISLASFIVLRNSSTQTNTIKFMKGFYGSFILKFFLVAVVAFAYIMIEKKNINKPSLFVALGLYAIYTIIEISSLQRILRKSANTK